DADTARKYAVELVALAPDVVLASGTQGMMAIQRVNRPVPVVFALVADPVGAGFVDSLARPGGNATGFMLYEYSISGKWLELLKEIAPGVTRVAVLRDPTIPTGPAQFSTIQALAPSLGMQVNPVNARNANEVENRIATFARTPNGGLIVTGTPAVSFRHLILNLPGPYNIPAISANISPPPCYPTPTGGLCGCLPLSGAGGGGQARAGARQLGPDPKGRDARRPAGTSADEVRACDQSQDRQGARLGSAAYAARPRR